MTSLLIFAALAPLTAQASSQLLSARYPSLVFSAGGNGSSAGAVLSPDGRYVLFTSGANNLVPGDNSQPGVDIFLRDRTWNTTTLVSARLGGGGGGNGDSTLGQLSVSGRYVVFQSDASDLVAGDTNGVSDIFVRDLVTGTTRLVSVAADGGSANGASSDPVMTPDGTCVAFVSKANNLVAGDANGIADVFVRDLITQTTWLVSLGAVLPSGSSSITMGTPVITPDGRFVAFFTDARGLTPGVPTSSKGEVYVRDRMLSQTTWASTNTVAIAAYYNSTYGKSFGKSYHPRLSDDGRYVGFKLGTISDSSDSIILRYDSVASTSAVVAVDIATSSASDASILDEDLGPEMTPDGRFVAYVTKEAVNYAVRSTSVHVWDGLTGMNTLLGDAGTNGDITSFSRQPVLTPDGRFVAFLSNATNLVGNAIANGYHIYVNDLQSGTLQLADVDTNGVGSTANDAATSISLTANGRWVAFSGPDGSLVNLDNNRAWDSFVYDLTGGTTELISRRDPTVFPQTGDAYSSLSQMSISADGRWVAFASVADDLIPNDSNGYQDIFAQDLWTGTKLLVSAGIDGSPAKGGPSSSPVISSDGRFVAFISAATNLVAGLPVTNNNVYRRDLQNGTTVLVSVSLDGLSGGDGDSFDPVMSGDGRYLAFQSRAGNIAFPPPGSNPSAFWRDLNQATNVLLGRSGPDFPPSISRDGRYVAYYGLPAGQSGTAKVRVRDTHLGMDIYTNSLVASSYVTSAALAPDGKHLLYQVYGSSGPANTLMLDDMLTGAHVLSVNSARPIRNAAEWSADGRYFAFVSTTNLAGGDDGTNKLFLDDLTTGTITLVNPNLGETGSRSAWFDSPAVSADGRFVAYRAATNSFPWAAEPPPDIFLFDGYQGLTTALATGQPGSGPAAWASRPAISGNGTTVAFLSLSSSLAATDLNRAPDMFASVNYNLSPLDSDADGIPDWWMAEFFGHATGQAGDLSRAQDDADGDGLSNLQEWRSWTDPTDPSSRLILALPTFTDSGVTLTWKSVNGVAYYLQRSTLTGQAPFNTIRTTIVGNIGTTSYTDTNTIGQGPLFYRVGVQYFRTN